jgi:hypothetical protein
MVDNIDFKKPINIKAFLFNEFHSCGCSEHDLEIGVIRELLEWLNNMEIRNRYDTLFNGNVGVYYLLIQLLENANLCEHGTSIRCPWITDTGKDLLEALKNIPHEIIDECNGDAYDGFYYN